MGLRYFPGDVLLRHLLLPIFAVLLIVLLTLPVTGQVTVTTLTEEFNGSGGVSVNSSGEIYVGDFGIRLNNANGNTVKRIWPNGDVTTFATGLFGASGNDFGSDGNLYQSNIGGNRISRITPSGAVSTLSLTNITAPVGCVVDGEGNIFSTNCLSSPASITKTTPSGTSTIFATSSLLSCPNGLTIDDQDNLYTCNFNNGWVVKITPAGQVSNLVNIPGGNNGHLTFANGRLYVVARCANQVYEVTLDGQISLLAGSGARGNADGPALQATFSIPNGIAASPDGDTLYINDATDLTGGCFNGPLNPVIIRMITGVKTGIKEISNTPPIKFVLQQNYPNPFNPQTLIRFQIPSAEHITLTIYNVRGEEVAVLVDAFKPAGTYEVDFDGKDLTSGVYLYRLQAGTWQETRKLVLTR